MMARKTTSDPFAPSPPKVLLKAILMKIGVNGPLGTAISTMFAGMSAAADITLTEISAVINISVDSTTSTCVATRARCFSYWCYAFSYDTGESHWEPSKNKAIKFQIDAGGVPLTGEGGGIGIVFNDPLLAKYFEKLASQIEKATSNLSSRIQQELQNANPGATVQPIGP